MKEIVVVAADGAAGHVEAREIGAGHVGGVFGQHAALNLGGLGEVALHDALGLFDFGEAGVLDADGGDVGHHGEQVEIVLGEFAQNEGRIDVDEADDAVLGLQRDGHHGVDLLLHDAHAALEGVVELGVAHQHRRSLFEHAVADGGADAEAIALVGARHQFVAFEQQEHAALGADGLNGEVENHLEKFVERPILAQFLAGADQRLHGAPRPWGRRARRPWSGWRGRLRGW